MGKVVTERPRKPSGLKYNAKGRRARFKKDLSENAPTWEATGKGRKSSGNYKDFDDHIRPLEGYLKSRVGYEWNDTYSEISKNLPANSMAGHHIREQHIKSMVELNPKERDGKYGYYARRYANPEKGSNLCKRDGWVFTEYSHGEFYVDFNGILRRAPRIKYRAPVPEMTKKVVDDQAYEKIDGIWYATKYQTQTRQVLDSWSNYIYNRVKDDRAIPPIPSRTETYEILIEKKQLSSKELRALGLINDLPRK